MTGATTAIYRPVARGGWAGSFRFGGDRVRDRLTEADFPFLIDRGLSRRWLESHPDRLRTGIPRRTRRAAHFQTGIIWAVGSRRRRSAGSLVTMGSRRSLA